VETQPQLTPNGPGNKGEIRGEIRNEAKTRVPIIRALEAAVFLEMPLAGACKIDS